ncbi:MAG: FKBP-type peptidyl-prolyl cis-trans isomerase [Bacteroidales bacterium]|nr:FKBP-type peptidyl-prolyl cis-trans isomerase [Bacteroidales bacterium]MDD3891649.1 FKBP-type peptidyl-prolyl cis-trans isomerase [Bacteroidales bacterium]
MKLVRLALIPLLGLTLTLFGCNNKGVNVKIKTETDSVSYALGINIASSLKQGPLDKIDPAALAKGLDDAYNEKEGIMTNEEAVEFLNNFVMKDQERKAKENLEAGEKFLEENAEREGVIVDPEGFQYEILTEGNGPKPAETDMVKVHYHGTRIDGTVFDSSVERGEPAEFRLNGVIKGWTIGVQRMNVGSKYKFYFPSHLAYGPNPRPGGAIQPNDVLIFEIELLEIANK